MSEVLYKVLNANGSACHSGSGTWNRHGAWMPPIADIKPCERGYHLCREKDLLYWLGPAIWEAEYRGERIDAEDKIVVSEARLVRRLKNWNDRTARLFACDCAERSLPIFARDFPNDKRPAEAIRVARLYAIGKATADEIAAAWDAARDAAGDAAWAAAGAAAGDAERAWQTTRLMQYLRGEA